MPDYLENQEQDSGGFESVLNSMKAKYGDTSKPVGRAPRMPAFDAQSRIRELAPQYGLDNDFVTKIANQESRLQHYGPGGRVKTSPQGAVGLMQVLPATGRKYGYDVNDPEQNLHAGLSYLRDIRNQWGDDDALTLSGYHSGIEDAEKALRNPKGNPKTHGYVRSILGDDKYNQAVSRYSAPSQGAFGDVLSGIKAKYEPQAQTAPGSFDDVLNSVKARVEPTAPPSKAQWGDAAPVTPENVQARIDELRTNQHVPDAGGQKVVYADDLAKLAQDKYGGDETKAATAMYDQGYTIMQRVAPDVQPIVSRATGATQPPAPIDAHAVPQRGGYVPQSPPQVAITINPDESPDVQEIGRRVAKDLGFTPSEAEQYAKEKGAPDVGSAFYANYGDPLKAAAAVKQMAAVDPSSLGRVNIPGLNEKAIAETKQWLDEKRQREYQQGMEGWHQATLERLASLSPEQREQAAYARAQQGPVPDDVRQALNVSPGVAPRLIAGTAESLMPWLPAARKILGVKSSTADDVATGMNAAAQGTGGVIRSLAAAQQAVNAPLYHVPGISSLLNWRDEQINGLVDEVSQKAQSELNLHKPSGLYGEILESSSRMAPEVAASILLPEGKAVHLAYWATLAFHNAKDRGASDEDALKEAALAGAMIGAGEPLRPLAGAVGDTAKEILIKAGARAGLGAVTGYGIAKAQGASNEQAISQAVQFGAMNLAGAGGREGDERLQAVPNEAAPRVQAFDVPEGMATATGREIVNPRAGAATRAEYEAQRANEEAQQQNNAGMPRLAKRQEAPQTSAQGEAAQTAPESRAGGVVVTARGADPLAAVQEIQDAVRQGERVQIARGGDDEASHELYSALADEFGDHPGVSFASSPQAQRGLSETTIRPQDEQSAFESALNEVKRRVEPQQAGSAFDEALQKVKQRVEPEQSGRVVTVNDKQITLTDPEQIAALDEAQSRYNRQIELARQAGGDRGAALSKQAGMEFATEKRHITGELTDKERQAGVCEVKVGENEDGG